MQNFDRDEELMTDYQFKCYKEERDEKDAMLRQEMAERLFVTRQAEFKSS